MWEAERRVSCELRISVGMCVHRGVYFELGNALYGGDAHMVESLAEHRAGPGEILVTAPVRTACPGEFTFRSRPDLERRGGAGIFSLRGAPRMRGIEGQNRRYPHPYPADFFDRLTAFTRAADKDTLRQQIYDTYLRSSVIVFLARERAPGAPWDGAFLLDDLVANVLLDALVTGLESVRGHVAGLGGGLGILSFEAAEEALEAAQALRRRFSANGLAVKIGIASGPVLSFSNPRGPSGITGTPVHVASKLSEDGGVVLHGVTIQSEGFAARDNSQLHNSQRPINYQLLNSQNAQAQMPSSLSRLGSFGNSGRWKLRVHWALGVV